LNRGKEWAVVDAEWSDGKETQGTVDIGILSTRDDEFRGVLAALRDKIGNLQGARRAYPLRCDGTGNAERYRIGVLRLVEQGPGRAPDVARDLIDDLGPRLVLVVGIAGARTSDDVKLGGIVIFARSPLHRRDAQGRRTSRVRHERLPCRQSRGSPSRQSRGPRRCAGDWMAGLPEQPPVSCTQDGQLYRPPDGRWQPRGRLEHHYGPKATPRAPAYAAGSSAASDRLVEDPELLIPWLQTVSERDSSSWFHGVRRPVHVARRRAHIARH
jgi:hypothetical protein